MTSWLGGLGRVVGNPDQVYIVEYISTYLSLG